MPDLLNSSNSSPVEPSKTSPMARYGLFAYVLLVAYATLFPFTGWRDLGLSPWAYLQAPPQRYLSNFDIALNILGYLPLGWLCGLALYPRVRRIEAIVVVAALGLGLSITLEATQTYLPQRVPSNLDVVCNLLGSLLGGLLASVSAARLLADHAVRTLRYRWLVEDASGGLILLLLWLCALLYPQPMLFGLGDILKPFLDWLQPLLAQPLHLHDWYRLDTNHYVWAGSVVTACQLAGCTWLLGSLLRTEAPRMLLIIVWFALAILVKTLSHALLFQPESAFEWITPAAKIGVASALIAVLLFSGKRRTQRRLAVLALSVALLLVNFVPENLYFEAALEEWNRTWSRGLFLRFSGLTEWLAAAWPYLALIHLTRK